MIGGMRITVPPGLLLVYGKGPLRKAMGIIGREIAAAASALASQQGSGRRYQRFIAGQFYRASAPGQPPARRTGILAGNIAPTVFRNGQGVSIRDRVFYSKFMETGAKGGGGNTGRINLHAARTGSGVLRQNASARAGSTRVMAPRPFMTTALEQAESSINERIRAAVMDGIEFKRRRA